MNVNRRTQADRSAATRGALVAAARTLFAQQGYAGVGTETIVRAAGVTRGAMYHQFADKAALFEAVFEAVEQEVTVRMAEQVADASPADARATVRAGAEAWLDVSSEPDVQRIVLIDGPAVLGWERWREIGLRHGMGLVEAMLTELMSAGAVAQQPVRPLAHVLIGALDEAALYVARASDQTAARAEVGAVVGDLVASIVKA